MPFLKVVVLAIVQGLAELLPVSSSAHVVVAEKLMGLDPASPPMTLLLVMLHTGTMFAVIAYFWNRWRASYFANGPEFRRFALRVVLASALTAVIGEGIILLIEHTVLRAIPHAQIEDLFSHLEWIAPALAAAGLLILWAGLTQARAVPDELSLGQSALIGAVQGLCLPLRGLSRSGATISAGMLAGVERARAESFSFALAVVLTPAGVAREALRVVHAARAGGAGAVTAATTPSLLGAVLAFLAGLVALRWLSRVLESGRWYLFGIYCLVAAIAVLWLHHLGY